MSDEQEQKVVNLAERSAQMRVATSALVDRLQFFRQAGITFHGKRDTYEILGYSRVLTTVDFRDRYARGGLAGRIVDVYPSATWRGDMELIEDEDPKNNTAFEQAWDDFEQRLQVTSVLMRADKLSQIGYYSVVLIGAPGNFNEELPKGNGSTDAIMYLTPFTGGGGPGARANGIGTREVAGGSMPTFADATISTIETDPTSPRFGLPLTYQLRRTDATNPQLQKEVHWSRVLHIAENCLDNDVYGMPRLERVWNLLDDLDKVTGGGAEAFWLRANQGMQLDVDKDMKLSDDEKKALKDQADEYQHQIRRMLRTRGVKVNALGSAVANFGPNADAIITQIAGSLATPKRILTGSEMGELASSQDRDNWKDQIDGRQQMHAGPNIVRKLVNHLVTYGYLPTPKKGANAYDVKWPHMQVMTEQEKADGAQKWASVNQTMGMTVFTEEEIRNKWYGMEPAEEADTEKFKADLALTMATVNKTQGIVVFTPDEIRETCYGWPPLDPDEMVPVGAPERITVSVPPPEPGEGNPPTPGTAEDIANAKKPTAAPALTAAEKRVMRALEVALAKKDLKKVGELVGIS